MTHSGSRRIAERYVKALFDVAKSASAVDKIEKDLEALGQALQGSAEFRHFLINPLLSHAKRAEVMLAMLEKLQVSQLMRQFIGMLIQQKRLNLLSDIALLFKQYAANERGELNGELITASPLAPNDVEQVRQRLSQAYGKQVHLQVRQDSSLLGGMIIKIGSLQLDGSLSGKLQRLKTSLQAA